MPVCRELKAACAAALLLFGASFMSGRETAFFFSSMGAYSWVGISFSSIIYGAVSALMCRFASPSLAKMLHNRTSARTAGILCIFHTALMLIIGAHAIATAAHLGKLWFDLRCPELICVLATLILSIICASAGTKSLASIGILAFSVAILFFTFLALDRRPINAAVYISNSSFIAANLPSAIFLGTTYAIIKSVVSCGVIVPISQNLSPLRFGIFSGLILFCINTASNLAIVGTDTSISALNLPTVVLASRFGSTGYYFAIYAMWLGTVSVLSISLFSVKAAIALPKSGILRGIIAAAATILLGAVFIHFDFAIICICLFIAVISGIFAHIFHLRKRYIKAIYINSRNTVMNYAQEQILG